VSGYPNVRGVSKPAGRDRIVVGGVDVTFFRDKVTPMPGYLLTEPFAYGSTTLTLPQVHATLEAGSFGQAGDLSWVKHDAEVRFERVMPDDSIVTDYVGLVASIDVDGRTLTLGVGGQYAGRAANFMRPTPLVRRVLDLGHWVYNLGTDLNLGLTPRLGPVTGIEIADEGGMSQLAWAQTLCSMSQTIAGAQRTIMPTVWGSGVYQFALKDTTTKHLTIYTDDARAVASLTNDATEQPNTWFATGITPAGVRWRNAVYPGVIQGPPPAYPMSGGANFGVGTTDADTLTGDGITIMVYRLVELGIYDYRVPTGGVYTDAVYDAVRVVKRRAGLSDNGTMTTAAWDALYDESAVGYSLGDATILPMVQDDNVREWNRTSDGSYASRNDTYDPHISRRDRVLDFGPGVEKATALAWIRGAQARAAGKNWAGTIRLNNAGAFIGEHDGADASTLTGADIMAMRDIRPGMNAWLPLFDNGTLVHIAGAQVDGSGATLTVDTQARDLMELREILDRNRDSARDIRREWMVDNRGAKPSGNMVARDELFGLLTRNVPLTGNRWNVFPVIVGQHGSINRVNLRTINDQAKFAVAAFATKITVERLNRRVGNPLTVTGGESAWEKESLQDWYDDRILLYAAGDENQPCGYFPRRFKNDDGDLTGAPITGRHVDDDPWPYICAVGTRALIYLAIYPDRDCTLKRGQILWPQLDDAV